MIRFECIKRSSIPLIKRARERVLSVRDGCVRCEPKAEKGIFKVSSVRDGCVRCEGGVRK